MSEGETLDQMLEDSALIIRQMSHAKYETYDDVRQAICMLYVPDMSISRSGISHALKELEKKYKGANPQ